MLTGEITLIAHTPVAKQSVVEVSLEKLDPDLGEDFGWRQATGW